MARTTQRDREQDGDRAQEQDQLPPPGWYPDPTDDTRQRFWDGTAWTTHTGPLHRRDEGERAAPAKRSGPVRTWERAAFVVTYLLGGILLGPFAMRHAGRAEGARAAGDRELARKHARRARAWTIAALVVGLALVAALLWWLELLPTVDVGALLP